MRWFLLSLFFLLLPISAKTEDCKRAVELYNRGTLSNNDYEKEKCFREAISLCSDPEVLSRIYNNLADVYEIKGRFSKALQYYRKAIETKPDLSTPYFSVGDIFFRLEDYYSAFIMYGKGLKYSPDDKDSLKNRERAKDGFKKKMVIYFDLNSFKISELYIYRLQLIEESYLLKKSWEAFHPVSQKAISFLIVFLLMISARDGSSNFLLTLSNI